MKRKYLYFLTILVIIPEFSISGQSDICLASFWNNRASFNPAFIARTDYLYLFFNARHQWLDVNGAPVVYNAQISEYLDNYSSAVGLSLISDKIGATRAYNPMFDYAFRIARKQKWSFSMGLSAGVFARVIDGSLLEAETTNDPAISYDSENNVSPDINIGFEFQNSHFIYGLASTHILSLYKSPDSYLNTNHRYAYAIYKNDNKKLWSYTVGMQVINRSNLTILEGNFTFQLKHLTRLIKSPVIKGSQETIDLGLTYRSSRQLIALLGIMASPYLRLGYAYDQSLFSGYYKNGTHEIMIEYRIPARAAATTRRCGSKEFWYH